ncbi:MAG: pyrimidine-nucleoside phosphorylase [Calditrichia bacterium]
MTAYEIIAAKRDGKTLTEKQIRFFIDAYLSGEIQDYQMSAFLMAVFFKGMTPEEIHVLTDAYIKSGEVYDLSGIPGKKIDKHSSGGVGDKVSIVLAPLVASLGVPVPMISGRGLGHTGGTLDKLESIPGFQVFRTTEEFVKQLEAIGVAMQGQTREVVPADRRIYALRDVTATVESIPLITASIMSKKIAEGIDGLVLDVKFGNGAFMQEVERARELARQLIQVGSAFGKKVVGYLTSMEQPLGNTAGNWLEIRECIDCFHGKAPQDLLEVTLQLSAEMVWLGEKAASLEEARKMCEAALQDGRAWKKMLEMVEYQGGDVEMIENPDKYPAAKHGKMIVAEQDGILTRMDTRGIGLVAVELGAGRLKAEDPVDPQAGIVLHKKCGDTVKAGEPLAELFTNKAAVLESAEIKFRDCLQIGEKPEALPPLILERIEG